MSLTNNQYNKLINDYKMRQSRMVSILDQRQKEILDKVDGYKQLDDQIAIYSLEQIKKRIYGGMADTDEYIDKIDELSRKKRDLLVKFGYPEDYLDEFYDCCDCKDTGYIDDVKCHCFKKKEALLLLEQSNLKETLKDNNFSKLSYDYYKEDDLERFKKAVYDCKRFIDTFGNNYENILFQGNVGTGKSFLSSCIAYELLNRDYQVIYFSASELFDILSDAMFSRKDISEANSYKEIIYNADLLIIDDLGTEVTNQATITQLFSVLNERHLHSKATIISTNLNINQIQDRYTDRIFSRLLERYSFKKIDGPDIRKIKHAL